MVDLKAQIPALFSMPESRAPILTAPYNQNSLRHLAKSALIRALHESDAGPLRLLRPLLQNAAKNGAHARFSGVPWKWGLCFDGVLTSLHSYWPWVVSGAVNLNGSLIAIALNPQDLER
jgi:hypothetical protein